MGMNEGNKGKKRDITREWNNEKNGNVAVEKIIKGKERQRQGWKEGRIERKERWGWTERKKNGGRKECQKEVK